ncbi:porin [Thalassotalea sp. Y01]|uniref:porin n=1 Tax=Thalassotalea sp. Y01 TaxID=2729613 RepID=UPI00145E19F5|nr:porin [Thalassotalea sp. Y01]NMP16651.1 porin [Thalassotalea sp. Y01]
MKTKLATTSVLTALATVPLSSSAVEVYDDGKNTFNIGGYFEPNMVFADGTDEVVDGGSRINLNFTHQLKHGWTAFATAEWAVRLVSNDSDLTLGGDARLAQGESSDTLSNRLGFVGARHDKWGSVSVGKQWGSVYQVIGVTDNLNVFGGDAAGAYALGDGGYVGTGRAEQAIQYNNQFGNLGLSAQFQGTEDTAVLSEELPPPFDVLNDAEITYDNSYGVALTYQLPWQLKVGAAYNQASVEFSAIDDTLVRELDDTLSAVSVTYGTLGKTGLYAAAVAVETENHEFDNRGDLLEEASGIELMASYRFDNDVELLAAYNSMSSDDADNDYERAYYVAGAAYHMSNQFVVFSEYKLDESKNHDGSDLEDADTLSLGARYSF